MHEMCIVMHGNTFQTAPVLWHDPTIIRGGLGRCEVVPVNSYSKCWRHCANFGNTEALFQAQNVSTLYPAFTLHKSLYAYFRSL
jgi:hypothetical protein